MYKTVIGLTLSAALLAGCATTPVQPTGFYWGTYSRTLYAYEKSPGAETLEAHRKSLEAIIAKADTGTVKVPPGVYAELGKIYFDRGDNAEAIKWFQQEASTFPESAVLMKTLIEKAG